MSAQTRYLRADKVSDVDGQNVEAADCVIAFDDSEKSVTVYGTYADFQKGDAALFVEYDKLEEGYVKGFGNCQYCEGVTSTGKDVYMVYYTDRLDSRTYLSFVSKGGKSGISMKLRIANRSSYDYEDEKANSKIRGRKRKK
jgi:hypothetical protein